MLQRAAASRFFKRVMHFKKTRKKDVYVYVSKYTKTIKFKNNAILLHNIKIHN